MDNFQSGKTQAIDLDELNVQTANRPPEQNTNGNIGLDKWGDDPWSTTEESRQKRRWAEDDRWAGQDAEKNSRPNDQWDVEEPKGDNGWRAPKRGDVLETSDGWEDWGAAPKEMALELETKDNGGYRRVQAASQYAQANDSDYASGRAQRDDIYHQKEVYGTAGIPVRSGDPYASVPEQSAIQNSVPDMKPVDEWNDNPFSNNPPALNPVVTEPANSFDPEPVAPEPIALKPLGSPANDDIPGKNKASLIIFQPNAEPSVYEITKMSTTIGRALDNMVVLNDKYASRHHLVIKYVSGRYELFSLSEDNIASANGCPFSHIRLMNRDLIEVGATRIRFVFGPVNDTMLSNTAPINGKPDHVDPPPQEVRSPENTRKNLILLIAGVAVIVVFLIGAVVIIAIGKSNKVESHKIVDNAAEQQEAINKVKDQKDQKKNDDSVINARNDSDEIKAEDKASPDDAALNADQPAEENPVENVIHIQIKSEPSGAQIINPDGSVRGTTPYDVKEKTDKDAKEKWTIRLENYVDQEIEVSLNGDINQTVKLTAVPVEEEEEEKAEPAPAAKPKKKHVHKSGRSSKGSKGKKPRKGPLI